MRAVANPNAGSAVIQPAGTERGVVSVDGILAIPISLHFATKYSRPLDSLSANAYGLYLVHHNFVTWLQFALLGAALFAVIKAAVVFAGTLVLSWIAVLAVQRIPFGAQLIGEPRAQACSSWCRSSSRWCASISG